MHHLPYFSCNINIVYMYLCCNCYCNTISVLLSYCNSKIFYQQLSTIDNCIFLPERIKVFSPIFLIVIIKENTIRQLCDFHTYRQYITIGFTQASKLRIAVLTKVLQYGQFLKSSVNSEKVLLILRNLPIISLPQLSITIEIYTL